MCPREQREGGNLQGVPETSLRDGGGPRGVLCLVVSCWLLEGVIGWRHYLASREGLLV